MVADIALIVTAIGVLGAVYSLRQSYRERLRQFEAMYVERYWSLLDQLSLGALRGSSYSKIDETDERAIRAYIRLCEDELEMRQNAYIGDTTYRIWSDAICEQFTQPMFQEVWKAVREESTFPYGHTERLLTKGNDYDPLQMRPWRRQLRGLAGLDGV
jgi:hypothetical protein